MYLFILIYGSKSYGTAICDEREREKRQQQHQQEENILRNNRSNRMKTNRQRHMSQCQRHNYHVYCVVVTVNRR